MPGATIAVARFGELAYFETIAWAEIGRLEGVPPSLCATLDGLCTRYRWRELEASKVASSNDLSPWASPAAMI